MQSTEYEMSPPAKGANVVMLEVIEDITHKKIWEDKRENNNSACPGSLPEIIKKGSITWTNNANIKKGVPANIILIESNRYCANIPGKFFRVIQSSPIYEIY